MVYNFALPPLLAHSIHRGTCKTLTQWAKGLSLPSDQVCFFNFTASHDGVGLRPVADLLSAEELNHLVQTCVDHGGMVSYRNNRQGGTSPYELNCSYIDLLTAPEADQASRVKRMLLSQGTVLAMPGVPGIYFHSLFGSRSDPQGAEKTGLARSINREKLNADVLLTELATPGHLRRLIFRGIQNLLRARRSLKAMHPFAPFRVLDLDDRLFVMLRCSLPASDPAEGLLVLHNFAAKEVTVTLPESLSGFSWEVIEGKRHVGEIRRLGPYQMMWLQGEPIPLDLWGP
jgi:sucrose phosphorylase